MYSSHNYTPAGLFSGRYPGKFDGKTWNKKRQADVFNAGEGTVFTQQYQVPLWVGEFGSLYTGPAADAAYRLRALDEQIAVFEEHAAHWTIWTYKDVGVMGIVTVDPKSEYMRLIRPILRAKHLLGTDSWLDRPAGKTPVHKAVERLAGIAERTIGDPEIDHPSNRRYMAQALQAGYFASLMQPAFAKRFKGLSEIADRRGHAVVRLAQLQGAEGAGRGDEEVLAGVIMQGRPSGPPVDDVGATQWVAPTNAVPARGSHPLRECRRGDDGAFTNGGGR